MFQCDPCPEVKLAEIMASQCRPIPIPAYPVTELADSKCQSIGSQSILRTQTLSSLWPTILSVARCTKRAYRPGTASFRRSSTTKCTSSKESLFCGTQHPQMRILTCRNSSRSLAAKLPSPRGSRRSKSSAAFIGFIAQGQ